MKHSQLVQRQPRHVLMYGATKSGKTTLASRLAYKYKLIWISIDGGHSILNKLPPDILENNVDFIVIPDNRANPIAQQTCRKLFEGGPCSVCHMHGMVSCSVCAKHALPSSSYEFRTLPLDTIVVLDHGTQLSSSYQNQITRNQPDDYKLQLDDWGQLKYNLQAFFSFVQTAPFNVVVLAQMCEVEMEDKSKRMFADIGSSTFAPSAGQYFDDVVYIYTQQGYKATSSGTFKPNIIAGSRTDILIDNTNGYDPGVFFSPQALLASPDNTKKILEATATEISKPAVTAAPATNNSSSAQLSAGDRARALLAARRTK